LVSQLKKKQEITEKILASKLDKSELNLVFGSELDFDHTYTGVASADKESVIKV